MPPTPVSGAPRTSHDAADTPGIKSGHRSRSMRTSYTDAGVAVDGCSTLIDTEVGMPRKPTTAVRAAPRIYRRTARSTPPGLFGAKLGHALATSLVGMRTGHRKGIEIADVGRISKCRRRLKDDPVSTPEF